MFGGSSGARTLDTLIKSHVLYQLSYQPVMEREPRFELATPALARQCSTAELFPHTFGFSVTAW